MNVPIGIHLKSKDVIHSFFVPVFRLKQDAVPGRTIEVWFQATKPGVYEIPCAELCGFGHSGMLGHVTVQTKRRLRRMGTRAVALVTPTAHDAHNEKRTMR